MKKILCLLLALAILVCSLAVLSSCGDDNNEKKGFSPIAKEDLKIGLICIHDNSSTYDANFINSMYAALNNLGLNSDQVILIPSIPESDKCYEAAVSLVNQGCQVIFGDSFGHEDYLIAAAEKYPNVRFCHATGTQAHTLKYDNFSNAFASIYEGRYLAGVAAGMKLNELGETKMGYVGAFPYAEVVSGYTSFYLGAKSVCPNVTMDVIYTESWYDTELEYEAAKTLIDRGCVVISQHADSYGAPNACKEKGAYNVTYNLSTKDIAPNSYLIASKINWTPYFTYMINCTLNGEKIDHDWVGTFANGAVEVFDLNADVAANGTEDAINKAKADLANGYHVFSTSAFTVGGQTLTSYKADVDSDDKFTPDTEVIEDGYFHESEKRAAPYFDLRIDGITEIGTQGKD